MRFQLSPQNILLVLLTITFVFNHAVQASPIQTPPSFTENLGQYPDDVRFQFRNDRYLATYAGNTLTLIPLNQPNPQTQVKMHLQDSNPNVTGTGVTEQKLRSHFFTARGDKNLSIRNVRHFAAYRLSEIYPNIDLLFYVSANGNLEYDFELKPGADESVIRWQLEQAEVSSATIQPGALTITRGDQQFLHSAPIIYQIHDGDRRKPVSGHNQISNNTISFTFNDHIDNTLPLIIDPVIELATYLPDTSKSLQGVATDTDGNTYFSGYDSISNDLYVSKIDAAGEQLWITTIGGSGTEQSGASIGNQLALDSDGDIYVTGLTFSADFPVVNALQPTRAGFSDLFVVKLSNDGSTILYSTYLGGTGNPALPNSTTETAPSIAVDSGKNAFVIGFTDYSDFPVVNALQPTYNGLLEGFYAKINPSGDTLLFASYLGGSDDDKPRNLHIDIDDNLLITGRTDSTDFPLLAPIQSEAPSGAVFVTKINPSGTHLEFSTLLSGTTAGNDKGRAITTDSDGNIYVAGSTDSHDFITKDPLFADFRGNGDGFVSIISNHDYDLLYSTFIGGSDMDFISDIKVSDDHRIFLSGATNSINFPLRLANQSSNAGGQDAFLSVLSGDGAELISSSYYGGSTEETQVRVELPSNSGNTAILAFQTDSTDIETASPPRPGPGSSFFLSLSDFPAAENRSMVAIENPQTSQPESGRTISIGTQRVLMASMQVPARDAVINSVSVELTRSNVALADIKNIQLIVDSNHNNILDSSDAVIAEASTLTRNLVTLTATSPYSTNNQATVLFICIDF